MPDVQTARDVQIHAELVGDGRPVVLLHGWGFDHRIWERQVRVLAEAGHRVCAVDLRGHGRSSHPLGSYDLDTLASDVLKVVAETCDAPPVLVGWSLGGVTAFKVAVTQPDAVASLVLVGSNGVATSRVDGFPFGAPADVYAPAVIEAERADRRSARRTLLRNAFADPVPDRLVEELLHMTLETPSWAGAATLRTLLYADQVADVERLDVPVAQIIGAADPVFSKRGAAWLVERVPELRQVVLDGCGHFPMIEAPDAFDEALLGAVSGSDTK